MQKKTVRYYCDVCDKDMTDEMSPKPSSKEQVSKNEFLTRCRITIKGTRGSFSKDGFWGRRFRN